MSWCTRVDDVVAFTGQMGRHNTKQKIDLPCICVTLLHGGEIKLYLCIAHVTIH